MVSIDPRSLMEEASGQDLATLTKTGIGTTILAVILLIVESIEVIFQFLILPFELGIDIAQKSVSAVFIEPWNLLTGGGSGVSQGAISQTAESIAANFSFISLPVATGIVLLTILMVIGFLALSITSNAFPGMVVDNPIWDLFFGTAEEEVDEEG